MVESVVSGVASGSSVAGSAAETVSQSGIEVVDRDSEWLGMFSLRVDIGLAEIAIVPANGGRPGVA